MKKDYARYPLKIAGIGCYIPKHGVNGELHSDMALKATSDALRMADMEPDELDLIINISISYEKSMPEPATILQKKLGIDDSGIPCMTIQSGDLGFVAVLDLCSSYMVTNRFHNVLIVSSEMLSVITDPRCDENAVALMSDAAAAVIVSKSDEKEEACVWDALMKSVNAEELYSAGYAMRMFENLEKPWDMCIKLEFDEFAKQGGELLNEVIDEYQENVNLNDIDVVIPMQMPIPFYEEMSKRFQDQLIVNESKKYGYSGNSSIPSMLCKQIQDGTIKRGNKVLLLGVGAGIEAGIIKLVF